MDESPQPVCYEIRVRGLPGTTKPAVFTGLQERADGTGIVLTGPLPDQEALPGVLAHIEALGFELLELRRTHC